MEQVEKQNKALIVKLLIAVVGMFGFGFALVPLYDVMCDALGINGKTNTVSAIQPKGMIPDTSRIVRVEFMSHINPDMPWTFKPERKVMEVHPGQVIQTAYIAKNLSGDFTTGQAVPSVSPGLGASYFNKIECFCFNQQPLEAGESTEMPLVFIVDPELPEHITKLTLSYTLYDQSQKAEVSGAAGAAKTTNNNG